MFNLIIQHLTVSGIEREYEQKLMPDGRFAVDGFLCVFDVSAVPNRNPEKQTELVAQIILNLVSESQINSSSLIPL
jgi:hypothetical protein